MPPKSCHPRSLRVNQLDALFLDSELSQILSSELRGVLRSLPPPLVDRIQPELSAGIRLAFFLLSVARDVPSPGNKLQNLRYQDPRVPHDQHKLAFGQKLGFGITHVVGDWIWNRWSSFIVERGWGGFPIGSAKRAIYVLTRNIETLYRAAAIVNFLAFLLDGKYRTLLDRIFRMRLVHIKPRVGRQVAFDFMNQQLVWHGFSVRISLLIGPSPNCIYIYIFS